MKRTPSVFIRFVLGLCVCLGAVSGLSAQSINFTITGNLGSKAISGPDPLLLAGSPYTVTTSINPVGKSFITGTAVYSGLSVSITATSALLGQPSTFTCAGATATVVVGAAGDAISLQNCNINVSGATGSFSATTSFAPNTIASPIPLAFTGSILGTSTASYVLGTDAPTEFNITGTTTAVCSACPSLSLTPPSVTLTGTPSGPAQTQTITVGTGGTVMAYALFSSTTSGGSWLSTSVAGGSTGGTFNVTATPGTLAAGTYSGTVKVYTAASNSPVSLPVTFTVGSAAFNLVATPSPVTFNAVTGATTPSQSLSVTSSTGSTVAYTASATSTGSWLSISPTSGNTGGTPLTVSVNPTGLAGGTYSGTITLVANGATNSPLSVPVTLNVTSIATSPTSLSFSFTSGGTTPAAQSLSVTSTAGLPAVGYTASPSTTSGGAWLAVTPASGTTNGTPLSVSVIPGALAAGTYNGSVNITPTGATVPISVPVTFTVIAEPTITVLPTSLTFNLTTLGTLPAAQSVAISTSNSGAYPFTVAATTTSGGNWLSVTPGSGTTPGSVSVSITLNNLAAGIYSGSVKVTATGTSNSPLTIPVQLNVTAAPTISATPPSLAFAYTLLSGTNPPSQTTSISASGGASIAFTAAASTTSGGSWLSVAPSGGNTPATLTVSVNTTGLTAGVYSGTITLTSAQASNSGQTIPVTFTVSAAPTLLTSLPSLTFAFQTGGSNPAPQSFTVSSSGAALSFTAVAATTSGGSWLTVAPGSGTTPGSVTATVNATSLAAGTYNGSITVASTGASNSPVIVPVTLVVSSLPGLTTSPSSLTFNFTIGGTAPSSQTVSVGSTGSALTFSASTATPWLTVAQNGSSTPGSLTVSVNTSGLAAGTYNGSVSITASGASNSPLTYPVTLVVAAQPSLSVGPASLSFSGQTGGTNPAAQSLSVASTAGALSFTASASTTSGGNWLAVTPPSGTTNATLTVSVNTAGMASGTYKGTVTIAAVGAVNTPVLVPVTLTLGANTLTVGPTSMSFAYQVGAPAPPAQVLTIGSTSTALSFTAAAGAAWLSVAPTSGTTLATLNVSINTAGLTPGTYTSAVTITATGAANSPLSVPVTLTVTPEANIVATPGTLSFSFAVGGSAPPGQSVALSTSNNTPASYTATASTTTGGKWLAVSPASGSTPGSLIISVVPTGLAAGTYSGSVVISATGFISQTVTVTLTVTQPTTTITVTGNPTFTVTNTNVTVSSTLTIALSNGAAQAYTVAPVGQQPTWLTFTPTGGTTPGALTLTANPKGLFPGTYVAGLLVSAPGASAATKTISVQLNVGGGSLIANPAALSFNFQPGGTSPAPQSLTITPAPGNPATLSLGAITTTASWLSVSSASSAPATVQVSVSLGLLTPGNYTASIYVTALGSTGPSLVIPVTLTIGTLPALTATPTALSFAYTLGGTVPVGQSFALASNNVPLSFTVASPGTWLTVSPTRGTTPASVLVTANPAGLGAGSYTGTITVTAYGSANPVSVPVTLVVSGTGQLAVTPAQLSFAAPVGGPAPASQPVSVSAGTAIGFTAASNAKWLTATPVSGTTPATVTIAANPTGLVAGTYLGAITLTPTTGSGTPVSVMVTFKIGSGTGTGTPTINAVINAASGVVGTVSPGLWVSLFGESLGPVVGVSWTAPVSGETVATTLGGTQVEFDGVAVPLLYASNTQVNALVPFELTGKTSTVMQVISNGEISASLTLTVVPSWPGLFTADSSGKGEGAILNQDSSVNSSSNPAAQGSVIVLYGTGGGQTDPPSIDGGFNPLNADGKLLLPVTVMIGGKAATVNYYGPAPGLVDGVMQINAVLPSGIGSGAIPVIVTVGTAASQMVTVAVQ